MTTIADFCKELKLRTKHKKSRLDKPVACWSEPDRFNDEIIHAFVIILKTKGCSWAQQSGCSMCGYFNDSAFHPVSDELLLSQFQVAMESYKDEPVVKIFTSGSFFDTDEISSYVRDKIFSKLTRNTTKVSVESRPEYIQQNVLDDIQDSVSSLRLEVGIGLETSNDHIRKHHINKGFSFQDYKKAAKKLTAHHHLIKTYVLLKPAFLTEKQAIHDGITTIKDITNITDTISLNPANVQKNTLLEYLWKRQYYRPPWLWSVIEVLNYASSLTKKRIQCDIVGGGSIRGPHNCKSCDKPVLQAIHQFSLSQNTDDLNILKCDCMDQWNDQLNLEPLSFGSLIDVQRGFIP